ncbi:unnamed protein product [Caenorhabditis angaria]|uniref:BTB domain-containing protein n=1 Tax=Caenorhabditis angaria TaxID=860376 RepID=A0A9P1NAK1_9PELO|nr:unnamed protein product [Caenorhabditis angaria]
MPLDVNCDLLEEQRKVSVQVIEKQTTKGDVLTLIPKRTRSAVSMRADDTDRWGQEALDEKEPYTLMLRDPSVKNELLDRLNTFRRNRELCDVVLFVREREIFAHKVVLAAVSPALFDMFNDESEKEKENVNGVIQTNGTTNALVNFAYTAYLEINSIKVAELYKTAFALQMTPVIKACGHFLGENLQINNCIGIRRQANFQNDSSLMNNVDKFIKDNFSKIVNDSKEFTTLPCIQTRIIIPVNDGNVKTHAENNGGLAEMALKYFQSVPHDRAEHAIDILTCKTHILYMDEDHLADCLEMDERSSVGSCDIIQDYKKSGKDRKDVAKAVQEPVSNHAINHRVNGAVPVRLNASRIQNMRASNESLDSVGTNDSDPQETIETLLIATDRAAPQYFSSLVVLYRRLCVISMQITDNEELLKSKRDANPVDAQKAALLSRLISCTGRQRTPLAAMSAPRCSIGASFLNGKIYVCGGYDRGECLKSVEEYDVLTGQWRNVASMKTERGRFDCAVNGGKVYAIAGSNGNNDLKSAETYDPKTNTWTPIPSLKNAKCHNGCASYDNFVYCIGGSTDQVVLKDCERYNVQTECWENIAPMEFARYQAGVCSWKGFIIAAGGCDRWNCMDTVEMYDPKTNTWRQLAKLRQARRGCAVAVVRDSLYVIGGHDGTQSLDSVEILDSFTATWRAGPALTLPRANTHAVVTAGNSIFALGGFNGNQFLDSIEILENDHAGWRNWQQMSLAVEEEDEENLTLIEDHLDSDVSETISSSP